jgi:hypothetical protein
MANVKDVHIEGFIHYAGETLENGEDYRKGVQDDMVMSMLSYLNLPAVGIRILYTGDKLSVDNEHGGKTTFYHFIISGQEAIWKEVLAEWVVAIMRVGVVLKATVQDIEERSQDVRIPIQMLRGMSETHKTLIAKAGEWYAPRVARRRG